MRDRLVEILAQADFDFGEHSAECAFENVNSENYYRFIADHLLANGVIVQARGHWKQFHPKWFDTFICSECKMMVNIETPFCPKCGAKMSDAIERSNENAE